ncbi:MAG: hypothetical protein JSU74_09545 [Candidatus Zixiibacteriota bacterium]|nr:MAG: hypothetical protein JSU74_09545 [candidate division Zixibacteria bacterium]
MKRLEARHWTFLGLFVVVTITMLLNIKLEMKVSPYTQDMYTYIESLPEGSVLIISFDHEASSLPEIRPIALAVLRHAFKKGHKLIGVSLLAEGTLIGYRLMRQTADELDLEYGRDYAYLGFRPQYIAAILAMGESIQQTYPRDYLGAPYEQFELLNTVENYNDVAAVISIADGSLTTHWIEYGQARYGVKVLGAVTAAMVTTYDPYLASGQMYAMMGGLRGAAEYEKLIERDGGGARGMLAQSSAHLYVILLVVLGNIVYFVSRKQGGGS